jgi:single-stranded-DNA-specific exonuclease
MPSANVAQLRTELDAFARSRLTLADFAPVIGVEAELDLDEITPALFQMLCLLEPYGAGNHEPAFCARGVSLIAPPKILKDKHIKLKLKSREKSGELEFSEAEQSELSAAAILATPRCHPDSAAVTRAQKAGAAGSRLKTETKKLSPVFSALGWHMAERLQQTPLLAGDAIDIAFTIGHNDHPEFGGLELGLRDFVICRSENSNRG